MIPDRPHRTITINRLDSGPRLVIEDAAGLAWDFFTKDDSSVGRTAFDAKVGQGDPFVIAEEDVVAINQTMRARSPHKVWADVMDQPARAELLSLDPTWDLYATSDDDWARLDCEHVIGSVLTRMIAPVSPGRNLSVLTKVLHLKRPNLIPVLDSLVVNQIGGRGKTPHKLVGHMRQQGRANLESLHAIQAWLATQTIPKTGDRIVRTKVRILDALLWASNPSSGLAFRLGGWEHVVRVRGPL